MSDENKNTEYNIEDDLASHDYDGIKELNNYAPIWIIILFLGSIAFSGIYAIHYFGHPNNEMDQASEYNKKSAAFDAKLKAIQPQVEENMNMEAILAEGAELFTNKGCIACHGIHGEGNAIGPNLTDNFWLNGCSQEDIIQVITEGKPQKGMTPYKTMMSASQIKKLSTYIQNSLIGSNPENEKAPQGEECK